MNYKFRGSLCGWFCDDCEEQLSDCVVRIYRNRKDQPVTALAVAHPNDTLRLASDEEIQSKASMLIAETRTDADGNFSFDLGKEQKYSGEAFEIDVYCGTVPHRKPGRKQPQPRQFSITTLQPMWKQTGEADFVAIWKYCIPFRFWCYFRSLFDAWVICGRLTACADGSPIAGAVVSATDVDWIQDDPLGFATTDATGHFRIDYTSADFQVTPFSPWINTECVSGPDVYFRATLGPDVILNEPSSMGRTPGRENIGPCFCVDLCSSSPQLPPEKVPHWQQLSDFNIHPDAGMTGSQFSVEGYAGGGAASYVFGGGVLLHGNCPLSNAASPTHALQYRFLYGEYTWSGTPDDPAVIPSVAPGGLTPVTQILDTKVGHIDYLDAFSVPSTYDVILTSSDLDPATGWVTPPLLGRTVSLDMHNLTFSPATITELNFQRTDGLIVLNTNVITAAHPAKSGGIPQTEAGRALTTAEKEPIRRYKLQFEVRDATTLATVFTDKLTSVIFSNNSPIVALDMEELILSLCNPLAGANTAHVLYTIDHPHLRDFALSISNNVTTVHGSSLTPVNSPPFGFLQLPQSDFLQPGPNPDFFFRGRNSGPHNGTNTGGYPVDIHLDLPCAYRVTLSWQTRIYTEPGHSTEILYCR